MASNRNNNNNLLFYKYTITTAAASEIDVWHLPSLATVFTNFEGHFETPVSRNMYALNLEDFEMTTS